MLFSDLCNLYFFSVVLACRDILCVVCWSLAGKFNDVWEAEGNRVQLMCEFCVLVRCAFTAPIVAALQYKLVQVTAPAVVAIAFKEVVVRFSYLSL